MKNKIFFAVSMLALAVFSVANTARAAMPTLSVSVISSSQAQITVNGDPNSNIVFYYNGGSQTKTIGVTDAGGSFSQAVNTTLWDPAINSGSSVYVNINGQQSAAQTWPSGGSASSGSLTFSPSSLSLSAGQVATFSVSGGSGYFVSANSNTAAATHSINGNIVTVTGVTNGSATITVCSAANGCGSVVVTVGSGSGSTGGVIFGTPNPSLAVGAVLNMSLSGGSSYYLSGNSNANAVQVNVSGNALVLTGLSAGSSVVTVCGSGLTCSSTTVTVSVSGTPTTTTNTSTNTTTAGTGSSQSVLAAIQAMQAQLVQILAQIQSMASTLTQLAASAGATTSVNTNTGSSVSAAHSFTQFLSLGSTGEEVTLLQQKLKSLGFFTGTATGYFGPATESAVSKYQAAHSIPVRGYVGPDTRSALNND